MLKDDLLIEELARAIHDGLGGNGWAYMNYGGDEFNSCRENLDSAARAILPIIKREVAKASDFQTAVAYDCGIRAGQEDERKAIVAWLREQDGHGYDDMRANCIEAGEHRLTKGIKK